MTDDALTAQLALEVDEDEFAWDDWLRSLPVTPGVENAAAEIRLRAERRAGELLDQMPKNEGTRTVGGNPSGGSTVRPPDDTPRLSDFGVSKSQSSRYQQVAERLDALKEPTA